MIRRKEVNDYLSVEIRWLTTAQASSGSAFLITDIQSYGLMIHVHLRFDATADNINGPSRANQSTEKRILEDDGFDCLQSFVRFDRSQDRFPQVWINLGRMNGSADKSVVEYVACVRCYWGCGIRARNKVLRDSLGATGFASISVMKAAKRPMLYPAH